MNTGEKIKVFRLMRGLSQNVLGQLAGIDGTTIRKYELGSRNPKPDQLLKIANALGISINVFMDFDIETVSDVLTLLFKMDEQIDMTIDGDRDKDGNIDPNSLFLQFKHPEINERLAKFDKAKRFLDNLLASEDAFPSKELFEKEVANMTSMQEEMKQHLLDSSRIVKKDVDGIAVKIY